MNENLQDHTHHGPPTPSVPALLHHLDDVRQARNKYSIRLLQDLTPHLHAARAVERELDRHLARRFNTFRYLRDDELGLSRIIADLLDPTGEHGQGTTFLEAMIELLGVAPDAGDPAAHSDDSDHSGERAAAATWKGRLGRLRSTASDKIRVVQERGGLPKRRRIDITVDIPTDDGFFCLAFENKPYADDQPEQCKDYLEFLDGVYRGRFLLVYLPPRYRMPDESSLPPADRKRWKNHFRVLPYVADDGPPSSDAHPSDGDGTTRVPAGSGEDDSPAADDTTDDNVTAAQHDAAVGDGASLADWFGTCCKLSDAERLRWFLREAQLYCQHHFGDSTMTDTEARYIREYLDENPRHLRAAFAVARAWPAVKHDVCRRFLEHLRDRVEERVQEEFSETADDLDVGCHYGGDKNWSNYLWIYRYGWVRWDDGSDPISNGRTAVVLQSRRSGPASWQWGVRCAKSKANMTEAEHERRQGIEAALHRNGLSPAYGPHWPNVARPRHQDWSAMVPELVQELDGGGGKITNHYVNGLLRIAEKAMPAINEVELEKG